MKLSGWFMAVAVLLAVVSVVRGAPGFDGLSLLVVLLVGVSLVCAAMEVPHGRR